MSNISSLVGTAGGFKGTGVDAPRDAGYTTPEQAQTAYEGTQASLNNQQAFLQALQAQNGLLNQANVFSQQQGLANQLQSVANGGGPNPAMAQLNQATGANVANQAALMAGQRGSGANAGMMARLAAQRGGDLQQQAVGQGATMQAQQSLGAMAQLAAQQANMGNMANTQVGNQMGQTNANTQSQMANHSNIIGAGTAAQSNMNQANTALISGTAQQQAAVGGGAMSGAGSAMAALAEGGMVEDPQVVMPAPQVASSGPQSGVGKLLKDKKTGIPTTSSDPIVNGFNSLGTGIGTYIHNHPSTDTTVNTQETISKSRGGDVPGKAPVPGDSYANDIVSAKLSPGEIVIPRSITMGPNAAANAAKFVEQELSKHGSMKANYAEGGAVQDTAGQPPSVIINNTPPPSQGNSPFALPQEQQGQLTDYMTPMRQLQQRAMTQTPQALQMNEQRKALESVLPKAPQMSSPQQNIDLGGNATQAPRAAMPSLMDQYNPTQGYNTQIAGINKQAALEGQMAQGTLPAMQEHTNALRNLTMEAQQNAWNHNVEVENIVSDMKNDKIDPNRYVNNMGTGKKISTAIGLILGGIGGGLLGQENAAMKFLNESINRDVEGQKMEMGKKQNLLSALEKQYGDKQDAIKMLHSIYSLKVENQIKEEAAKLGTPMALARAQQAVGPLVTQRNQAQLEVGMRQAMMRGMQGGDSEQTMQAMRVLNPAMAKEMEGRFVPGVGMASIPVPEAARDKMVAGADLDAKLAKLESFAKKHAGSVDPAIINEGKALAGEVSGAYRQATHSGVYKESDQSFINSMIDADPTKFGAEMRTLPGYKTVRDSNQMALKLLYKAHGLNYSMPKFNAR